MREHPGAIFKGAYDTYTANFEPERDRLQPVVLGAAIAGGFTSLVTTLLTSSDAGSVLENGKGLLIQKLDDNIVILNQHSADIAASNATIDHLKKDSKAAFVKQNRQHH